jgi:hypothetical protein
VFTIKQDELDSFLGAVKYDSLSYALSSIQYNVINKFNLLYHGKTFVVLEIHARSATAIGRGYLAIPAKNVKEGGLIFALNGSQGYGNGALDLFVPQAQISDYQKMWPLSISLCLGYPIIAPDSILFGAFPHQLEGATAVDSVIRDISIYLAGVDLLKRVGFNPRTTLVAGISWGGTRAIMNGIILANYIDNVSIYAAGSQIHTLGVDKRDIFNFSFIDGRIDRGELINRLTDIKARVRLVWGEADYAAEIDTMPLFERVSAVSNGRIEGGIVGKNHSLDVEDMKNFFLRATSLPACNK